MSNQNIQNNLLIESEDSYEVVLQALSSLKTIKSKFADLELSKNNNTPLTNDFKIFLFGIFNSDKKFFKDLMKTYNDKAKNIKEALLKDPYHFTKYFIQFLNEENIQAENPNYSQTYEKEKEEKKQDMSEIISLFKEYYKNTQKSIIADYIFFSEIILIQCDKCFDFSCNSSLNQMLELDVEKFQNMKKAKYPESNDLITLNRCLQYEFFKETKTSCSICKENNAIQNKLFLTNSKVLIIYLKRNEHKGVNDIKINEEIDLSKFYSKKGDKFYSKYILKSYISFKAGNENKYFVDFCISRNNNNASWLRFDKEYKKIQQNELFDSEPLLLFYESTEKGKKNKNIQSSAQTKVNQDKNNDNSMPYRNSINYTNQIKMKINQFNQNNNMINSMNNGGGIINNINNNMVMNNYQYNNQGMMNNNMGMNCMNNNNIRMSYNNNMGMNNNMNSNIRMINNNMGMNNMNNNMLMMNNNNINMGINKMGMNYCNNNNIMGMSNNNGMMNQLNPFIQNQFWNNNQYALDSNSLNTQSSSPSNTVINQDLINNIIENSKNTVNDPNKDNITITCVLISEDNKEDELTKVLMQIKSDEKVKEIINRYISKLQRDESLIKKFLFNDNELSKTSEQTASEINLTNNSVIKGIKDPSYDSNKNNNNNVNDANANNNNDNENNNNNNNNNNNANENNNDNNDADESNNSDENNNDSENDEVRVDL